MTIRVLLALQFCLAVFAFQTPTSGVAVTSVRLDASISVLKIEPPIHTTSPYFESTASKPKSTTQTSTSDTESLPPLVYLPGLDGSGTSAAAQFEDLQRHYSVSRFFIPPADRSSYVDLLKLIITHINTLPSPPIIIGESFGGTLALHTALRLKTPPAAIILVNPATSYPKTVFPALVPLLTRAVGNTPLYAPTAGVVLGATVPTP